MDGKHQSAMKILTAKNLEAGIVFWREEKKGWPSDLHNQLYCDLYELKQWGLTPHWWSTLVDFLWDWRAIRPKTKTYIHEQGLKRLHLLEDEYHCLTNLSLEDRPSISDFYWNEVSELFKLAQSIKGVDSPVFASKLCHFLLPNIYPVIDHAVIGVTGSYSDYWTYCSRKWRDCEEKASLIEKIKTAIGVSVFAQYPFSTKIVELCLIGKRQMIVLP